MATLLLAGLGASLGGSLFGGAAIGMMAGKVIGSLAGSYIDSMLFGGSGQSQNVEGPRLDSLQVTSATEGTPISKVFGKFKISGQIIWATNFKEKVNVERTGGKGVGGSSSSTATTYKYFANFAVGLCEGEINNIGRIWADGKEFNQGDYNFRVYKGTEDQLPDSFISSKQENGITPAYKGLAYVVFEDLDLTNFGNRIPNLTFEVFKNNNFMSSEMKSVVLIPGSGEYIYDTKEIMEQKEVGFQETINKHIFNDGTDFTQSIDDIQNNIPNIENVSLVCSWFGNDLRIGNCSIRPKTDNKTKVTFPSDSSLSIAGVTRSNMVEVAKKDGKVVFGGSVNDLTVRRAIEYIRDQNLKVTFYPFILMDIVDNNLPWINGQTSQPILPWRGRITSLNDQTFTCRTEVNNFFGSCGITDFNTFNNKVNYIGPIEWSYRRMILHYAYLCKLAGGVDTFIIGSEMVSATILRDNQNKFPFVEQLIQLATDVKSVLGPNTKITYAADWSEYFGYHPSNGDVYFHLDALWSSSAISAIGIDCYWPLSDWRNTDTHLDLSSGATSIHQLNYLKSNVQGGEGYDWYYASQADRDTQTRTPITDSLNKEWVWRYKDIKGWWENKHYNRINGVEKLIPTSWIPKSKPFWFTEIGCPSVNLGSNQPNVFVDNSSSESAYPYYSNENIDSSIQSSYLSALISFFGENYDGFIESNNPQSDVYTGRMVDINRIYVYAWDARPFPIFPHSKVEWSDKDNWKTGHWITGKFSDITVEKLLETVLNEYKFTNYEIFNIYDTIGGFIIKDSLSAREVLQLIELAFFIDTYESGDKIKFIKRGSSTDIKTIKEDSLVVSKEKNYSIVREQESELPYKVIVSYYDINNDYELASVESLRSHHYSEAIAKFEVAVGINTNTAKYIANLMLWEIRNNRETCNLSLPPSMLEYEVSDTIELDLYNELEKIKFRISKNNINTKFDMDLISIDPALYSGNTRIDNYDYTGIIDLPLPDSEPVVIFMDLPLLTGNVQDSEEAGYVVGFKRPFTTGISTFRGAQNSSLLPNTPISVNSILGYITSNLGEVSPDIIDLQNEIEVTVINGFLYSINDADLLNGGNLCAIRFGNVWEILQYKNAELIGANKYKLTHLIRGKRGTRVLFGAILKSYDNLFVSLLRPTIFQVDMDKSNWGIDYTYKYGPANKNIGDQSYKSENFTYNGIGAKPFKPTDVQITRKVNGDFLIKWKRQDRRNGDSWVGEVPMSESSESYKLEFYTSNSLLQKTIKRTVNVITNEYLYLYADRIADFGSDNDFVNIMISQISSNFGVGSKAGNDIFSKFYVDYYEN